MYQPVRLTPLDRVAPGTRLLIGGLLYRHAQHTTLIAPPHVVRVIGEPLTWRPHHGQAVDLWGELLSAAPPTLLLHGARPQDAAWPVPAPGVSPTVPPGQLMRVTEHGAALVGTTADQRSYQLGWPGGRAGVYVISGHVSGLSPPWLSVRTATRVWPTGPA